MRWYSGGCPEGFFSCCARFWCLFVAGATWCSRIWPSAVSSTSHPEASRGFGSSNATGSCGSGCAGCGHATAAWIWQQVLNATP